MPDRKIELKEGIKAHLIKTDLFKTNLVSIILTVPLKKENVTKNALIPFLLKMGSKNYETQEKISLRLEELYGTSLNCGVDKIGDNQIIKFVAESIDNNYTLNGEDLIKDVVDLLVDVTFNPYLESGKFKESAIDTEKEHLKDIIEGRINNKDEYAYNRCLENMYEFNGYGLYRFGYLKDLDKITLDDISNYYFELINNAKIDIYISGNFNEEHIRNILAENQILKNLPEREPDYVVTDASTENAKKVDNPKEIQEKMDINQGKLVIGYNIFDKQQNSRNIGIVLNSILGDSANSMLFQNVREKAGLAYTARSGFIKPKNLIMIRAGIEIQNYDKALEIIKEQVENLKNGNFSEKDILNAKTYIISGIKNIEVEQDTEMVFYMGQELGNYNFTIPEYIKNINSVTKEQIVEFAKTLQMNTIFFLTGQEE